MPYKIKKTKGGKYKVTSPHGTKSKGTSKRKAEAQVRLLQGVEHGWHPTGKPAQHSAAHHAAKLYGGR